MTKFFLKNPIKILLFIVAVFVFCYFYFYNQTDLFEFPFNAQVWGTASDWIMILVTASTAFLLIMTLREQKRSNDIASNKDRREIMPQLSIDITDKANAQDHIRLILNNSVAYKLRGRFIDPASGNPILDMEELQVGNTFYISLNILSYYMKRPSNAKNVIEIEFLDMDKRPYKQVISINYHKNTFDISFPEQVEQSFL